MESVGSVRAVPGLGLEGDRYFLGTGTYSPKPSHGNREVTLIETETVAALFDGVQNAEGHRLCIKLSPAETRRNIATSGVPLNHLVDRLFGVGPNVLGRPLFIELSTHRPRPDIAIAQVVEKDTGRREFWVG